MLELTITTELIKIDFKCLDTFTRSEVQDLINNVVAAAVEANKDLEIKIGSN